MTTPPTPDNPADAEITLASGDLHLRTSPFGASLRGLWREGADGQPQEIVTGYSGAKGKVGGQGDVLIPFPGRVRDGRYTFAGGTYQMAANDKDGPNAIHGFVRLVPWEVVERADTAVAYAVSFAPDAHPGYPFALRAHVTYALTNDGMACRFQVENTGDAPAPVAAGFHPYFTAGSDHIDADTLHLPFDSLLEFENLLPTGGIVPAEGTALDFRVPRPIGATSFNTCFLHPRRDGDGLLRVRLSSPNTGRTVTVWMDAVFDYAVLYSGDPLPQTHRRRSLAIEPMTCGSDAFNHPDWGLRTLAPGETLAGSWGVSMAAGTPAGVK